ncbi:MULTISPECIES: hypothetical protein [unclassified Moorena]|nr:MULTISPECIES: hypothetical protein [unclassified Moorena]
MNPFRVYPLMKKRSQLFVIGRRPRYANEKLRSPLTLPLEKESA